ncbi:DUF1800 domain-containing protein [Pseudomonas fluorescens]|uniref:DUF1800 domain-containing protein n=1 Tax=Pseudomonas TaxID=286 RepID=UPI001A911D6B|nr:MULTISPECIES: DUF1800 domain-containing protein [Pseudomonas]MDZ5436682.1 DUF1800 domain-containing protein [Pseudomonas fluorescens]
MNTLSRFGVIVTFIVSQYSAHASNAPPNLSSDQKAVHVLERLGYGPSPEDIQNVSAIGIEQYILQQLNPESIKNPDWLSERLSRIDAINLDQTTIYRKYSSQAFKAIQTDTTARKAFIRDRTNFVNQVRDARILRALYSPAQLQEVMVDFWYNHFNIWESKTPTNGAILGAYENDAIRPYALGKFKDLLLANAKQMAMLYYLDNWRNRYAPTGKKGVNENYAREVMELHTLGVNGGYSQADIKALARLLSGWTYIADPNAPNAGNFLFDSEHHDPNEKQFLGISFPAGGGYSEGEQALLNLAQSPKTAQHIAHKLVELFVNDAPPQLLVNKVAQRYIESDGDIKELLIVIFKSDEFWSPENYKVKFKTPFSYMLSSLRVAGLPPIQDSRLLQSWLKQSGNGLFAWPAPDGYKNVESAWLSPDVLMNRANFSYKLAAGWMSLWGRNPEGGNPQPNDQNLLSTIGSGISPGTIANIKRAPQDVHSALILSSPDFMYR